MFTTFHAGHYIPLTWLSLGLDYLLWGMTPRRLSPHLASSSTPPPPCASTSSPCASSASPCRPATTPRRPPLGRRRRRPPLRRPSAARGVRRLDDRAPRRALRDSSTSWRSSATSRPSQPCPRRAAPPSRELVGSPAAAPPPLVRPDAGVLCCRLLSKSIVVTLPVTLLVLDVYPLRRLGGAAGWRVPRPWLDKLPFFALSAVDRPRLSRPPDAREYAVARRPWTGASDLPLRLRARVLRLQDRLPLRPLPALPAVGHHHVVALRRHRGTALVAV